MILHGKFDGSTGATTFRGFMIQGHSEDGDETIGYWKNVAPTTQGLDCVSATTASQNSQLGQCEAGKSCGVSI